MTSWSLLGNNARQFLTERALSRLLPGFLINTFLIFLKRLHSSAAEASGRVGGDFELELHVSRVASETFFTRGNGKIKKWGNHSLFFVEKNKNTTLVFPFSSVVDQMEKTGCFFHF